MRVLIVPLDHQNPSQALFYIPYLEKAGIAVDTTPSHFTGRWFLRHRKKGDIVHIHWTHPFFVVPGNAVVSCYRAFRFLLKIAFLRIIGVHVVWTVHNLHNHERHFLLLDRIVSAVLARLAERVTVHCSSAVALVKKWCLTLRSGKISVIPHGSFVQWYPETINRDEAREALGVAASEHVFLFFGTIREYKGIPDLVRAFRRCNFPHARLVIAGKPWSSEIETTVVSLAYGLRSISLILRFIPEAELEMLLKACDAVVLPFHEVLMSGSTVLAMSFGRPVIAPRRGCLVDLLSDDRGILYDGDDPQGLEGALKQALTVDLAKMGQRCRSYIEKFSRELVAEQYIRLYETIAGGNGEE